jgi:hypothetical protein
MTAALISAGVGLLVAILGYVFTYRTGRRLNERQDRLTRVNAQLAELYGPLLVLTAVDTTTWEIFKQRHIAGRIAYFDGSPRTSADVELWMTWVKTVWMPTNRRIFDILVSHGDLIVDDSVPAIFLDFCAHVQSYEAVLARWEVGDHAMLTALIDHPGPGLLGHVEKRYKTLKKIQASLLASAGR